jgi:5'(3')-deoxyribonucleotidase
MPLTDHNDKRQITLARLQLATQANPQQDTSLETANQIVSSLRHMGKNTNAQKAFAATADRPTVGFDVDDTLAQRAQAMLTVLNAVDGGDRKMSDVTTQRAEDLWPAQTDLINKFHNEPGFYRNQAHYEDCRQLMWALSKAGYHIIIATKRDAILKDVTMDWLKEHDFPECDDYVFGNNSKYKANGKFGKLNLVFIDDDPRNLFAFDRPTTRFVMPKRPWNAKMQGRPGYNVIDDLGEIYDMLGLSRTETAVTSVGI